MSTMQPARVAMKLADGIRHDGIPADIAADLAFALQEIATSLSTVIGMRGVAALHRRALFLASADHPWLTAVLSDPQSAADHAPLLAAVAAQDAAHANAGAQAVLRGFQTLLQTLVGDSLADRLLQPTLANLSQRASAQDAPR